MDFEDFSIDQHTGNLWSHVLVLNFSYFLEDQLTEPLSLLVFVEGVEVVLEWSSDVLDGVEFRGDVLLDLLVDSL